MPKRALLVAALLVAGCGGDFNPASYLQPNTLRILGVIAEPPQAAPGETTMMTLVGPLLDGTTYEWSLCIQPPPPGSSGTDELCLEADLGADFLIPVAGNPTPLPDGSTATVTMPADEGPSKLGVPDASGGFYLPVRVRAQNGNQQLDTIYGLRLGIPQLPPNHNPVIASVQLVEEPLDASPMMVQELSSDPNAPTPVAIGSEPTLRLTLTPDSYETYPTITGVPPNQMVTMTTEQPRFFWYADAGHFSEDTTGMDQPDTKLRLDDTNKPNPGDRIHLFVVVHDDRGGTAATDRWLIAQ
jgi:hypothetical protein